MNRFVSLGLFAFALGAMLHPAYAADTAINLGPAVSDLLTAFVVPILGTVIMAILSWIAWLVKQKLGIDIQASYLKQVSDFAEHKAGEILAKVSNVAAFDIDVRNPLIAAAANEAMLHIPEALAFLHVTPASVEAFVSHFIVAHLGKLTSGEPDVPGAALTASATA